MARKGSTGVAADPGLVGTTTVVSPDDLNFYYRNPRRGDVDTIMLSLLKLKQYKPLTVNIGTHTGRPNEVLAGNHTLMALRALSQPGAPRSIGGVSYDPADPAWQGVKVHWGDWSEEDCKIINLADNRIPELGGYDTAELAALLSDVEPVNLSAIGYTAEDLADLRASLEEQDHVLDNMGRQREDGLIDSNDLTNLSDSYPDALARLIVLSLPIPLFIWAQERLEKYRTEYGLETNTHVVLALLSDWSGDPIPEVSDED